MPTTLPSQSTSLWFDGAPAGARFNRRKLPSSTDVVVIGAGISGLVTAAKLVERGMDVTVLEARSIARGASGHSSAKVTVLHELHAHEIRRRSGEDAAVAYLTANQFGFDWIANRVADRSVDCSWETRPAITYVTEDRHREWIDEEVSTLRSAGISAERGPAPLPFPTVDAVRLDDQAQFDPVAFLQDLATEIDDGSGELVDGVRAIGLDRSNGAPVVVTDAGRIRCRNVVVATGLPFLDRSLLFARTEPESSYVIACRVENPPPAGMYLAADGPKRSLRTASGPDGSELLLVGGESHKTGQGGRTTGRYENLASWADTHFGVEEVTHRFMTEDFLSADQIPFAGPIAPGQDDVRVTTGYSKWGFTNAVAAAEVNVASIAGEEPPSWEPFFTTGRIPRSGLKTIAEANSNVAAHLVGGWAGTIVPRPTPLPGQGRVVTSGFDRVAVSVNDKGKECRVSGICPHLGAILTWNDAERTWDCPLHGSRFDADGTLLHGPAVDDLSPKD